MPNTPTMTSSGQTTQKAGTVPRITKNSTKHENIDQLLALKEPTNANIMTVIGSFMSNVNSQYESIAKSISKIQDESEELKADHQVTKNKLATLDNSVTKLSFEFNRLQQRELQNDVIISGIPECNMSKDDIISKLNAMYRFGLENIVYSYTTTNKRNGSQNALSYLTIRFTNSESKAQLIKAKIDGGPLFVQKLLNNTIIPGDKEIFVSDRLTPYNQNLMSELRKLKKNKQIYHCYYRHGNVYVKVKKEDNNTKIIRTASDVNKLNEETKQQ